MSELIKVTVPDLGQTSEVDVIEILVSPGDAVSEEDPLITLESEKASMEVPSPYEGTIKKIAVKTGDKVATGTLILEMESGAPSKAPTAQETSPTSTKSSEAGNQSELTLVVPDLNGAANVDVIEVPLQVGDVVALDDTLVVLEGEKATMEVPATAAGVVLALLAKIGDKVSQGDPLVIIRAEGEQEPVNAPAQAATVSASLAATQPVSQTTSGDVYAGPGVRRLARALNIELTQLAGSGKKGRVTREDLETFIKQKMQSPGVGVAPLPDIDFNQFGETETVTLSKIKRFTGQSTHRSWSTIPHVTQFDEADVTELEKFRKTNQSLAESKGAKLSPLVFIMKALVAALREFPTFNASLRANGSDLVLKKYFHVGIAVDTPNGLVVPVIRDVDQKGLVELAMELSAISAKARDKGLSLNEMQGSSMTISSLGGIGGTAFTPIVNQPDVAILGVSKTKMQPVYDGEGFVPRLMLPLSLSYDHRVIDGAEAARFTRFLAEVLSDIRRLLM